MDGNGLETERVGPLGNYVSFIEAGVRDTEVDLRVHQKEPCMQLQGIGTLSRQ